MIRSTLSCMGTGFVFQVMDSVEEQEVRRLISLAGEVLEDADQRFSLYKPESEISALVAGRLDWSKASGQALAIREQCDRWSKQTGGYFDARSGSDYDPSGLVKTWATQNAADFLQANGLRQFTINAGGDILLSSELNDPVLQRVGISNLKKIGTPGAGVNFVLDLAGTEFRAVATSGVAERGEHIWRKNTQRVVQASVAGHSLVEADIWATALVSGGDAAWEIFLQQPNVAGMLVFENGSMIASPGFHGLLGVI